MGSGNDRPRAVSSYSTRGGEPPYAPQDEPVELQPPQRLGQHPLTDAADELAHLTVAHRAVPQGPQHNGVPGVGGTLRDRVLIDCVNPVGPGFVLETAGVPSAAERLAAVAPGAQVVKAFNLCHEDVWRMTPPVFGGRPLAVPLCGDDEDALDVVRRLVRDLGCEPLDAGEPARVGLLEATAALLIGLWVGEGADAQEIAPPREFAGER